VTKKRKREREREEGRKQASLSPHSWHWGSWIQGILGYKVRPLAQKNAFIFQF
jgi:hypothetical protein